MRTNGVALLHVGTHKTGSTSLQALLGANEAAFAAAGWYLPLTGRLERTIAAQHNVAWELTADPKHDPLRGTLRDLLDEIGASGAPNVALSSEEFDTLHHHPAALRRLAGGLRACGYAPRVVVFLRPQADYCESLYAELMKSGWPIGFVEFFDGVVTECRTPTGRFDYDDMLRAFEDELGCPAVVVRRYRSDGPADRLLRDFVELLEGDGLDFAALLRPRRLNERPDFAEVYELTRRNLARGVPLDPAQTPPGPFDPLTLAQTVRIALRFGAGNRRVERDYGINLPCVSRANLVRAIAAAVGIDRAARRRRRCFWALQQERPRAAGALRAPPGHAQSP